MAIIAPLELAKGILTFPSSNNIDIQASYDNKLLNAQNLATVIFEKDFSEYLTIKNTPDNFNSISVIKVSEKIVEIELDSAIIFKLKRYNEIEVLSGNYSGAYKILYINTDTNKIRIKAQFFNEAISFQFREKQIYNYALAYYICAYARWTFQEIKDLKILVTASQKGDGNITSYEYNSINQFKNDMINEAKKLLYIKKFPKGF